MGSVAACASRASPRVAAIAAGTVAAALLSACGSTSIGETRAPAAGSTAARAWADGAERFVSGLQTDIVNSDVGTTLASARFAIRSTNDIYVMLVAYTDFGACNRELGDIGTPASGTERIVRLIVAACARLQHASALFQDAMTNNRPAALVSASRLAQGTVPLLAEAQGRIARIGT